MSNRKMQNRFTIGKIVYHNTIKELNNLTIRQLTKKMFVICYQDDKEYRFNVSDVSIYPE